MTREEAKTYAEKIYTPKSTYNEKMYWKDKFIDASFDHFENQLKAKDQEIEELEQLANKGSCEGCESNSTTQFGSADCGNCVDYCNYYPEKE